MSGAGCLSNGDTLTFREVVAVIACEDDDGIVVQIGIRVDVGQNCTKLGVHESNSSSITSTQLLDLPVPELQ